MIKEIGAGELRRALELVNRVFSEFVAVEYSEKGKKTFRDYLKSKYEKTASDLKSGQGKMWGYYEGGEIAGVIATRDITHISLMFVGKEHHRRGIARQLFLTALKDITARAAADSVTVNSSPYAVAVYERLGFVKMGEKQERDGIIFIPMEYRPGPSPGELPASKESL